MTYNPANRSIISALVGAVALVLVGAYAATAEAGELGDGAELGGGGAVDQGGTADDQGRAMPAGCTIERWPSGKVRYYKFNGKRLWRWQFEQKCGALSVQPWSGDKA